MNCIEKLSCTVFNLQALIGHPKKIKTEDAGPSPKKVCISVAFDAHLSHKEVYVKECFQCQCYC